MKKKKNKYKQSRLNVPEKYQPYKNVTVDRYHPKREIKDE